jgi:hypothetical protein
MAPPQPQTSGLFDYIFSGETEMSATLLSIGHRGAVALLIISVLFALAVVLAPFAKSLTRSSRYVRRKKK